MLSGNRLNEIVETRRHAFTGKFVESYHKIVISKELLVGQALAFMGYPMSELTSSPLDQEWPDSGARDRPVGNMPQTSNTKT